MGRGALESRRHWRLDRKQELHWRGIPQARMQRIRGVRITAIPMPGWARERRIRGLSFTESFVWLWPRDARFLMRLDHEAGGSPYCAETEYRLCPVCTRPLIGDEARARRRLDESCATGRQLPCGGECIEASRDGRWRKAI